jgi:hypothetical protein
MIGLKAGVERKASLNTSDLKSDYDRIESAMCMEPKLGCSFLKSDYDRIESKSA